MLYRWPVEGWVLGRVRRGCGRAGFSHVVGYAASSTLGAVEVDTLLDALSHGPAGRWHLLVPTGRPGVGGRLADPGSGGVFGARGVGGVAPRAPPAVSLVGRP